MSLIISNFKVRETNGTKESLIEAYCKFEFRDTKQFKQLKKKIINDNSDTNESKEPLLYENENLTYWLGSPIQKNEFLQIECFKDTFLSKK
jgi:hypothetical protein